MRRRFRLLGIAKWGAVLVCGLSFAIGVLSIWFGMALHLGDHVIDIAEARIGLLHIEGMDAGVRGVIDRLDTPHIGLWFVNESTSSVQQFYAPIWLLLLLFAAFAVVLSRLGPRHCKAVPLFVTRLQVSDAGNGDQHDGDHRRPCHRYVEVKRPLDIALIDLRRHPEKNHPEGKRHQTRSCSEPDHSYFRKGSHRAFLFRPCVVK